MKKNVLGLLCLIQSDSHIREFTERRAVATIPIAGRYRIIDFTLSNMVNSGIDSVGVMLPAKSRSMLGHLRSGKDWDLARRRGGLVYMPPSVREENNMRIGNVLCCYDNLDFVMKGREEYILFAGGDIVYNMDYRPVLDFYRRSGADVVAVCAKAKEHDTDEGAVFTLEGSKVKDIAISSSVKKGDMVGLGAYFMRKSVYAELVRYAYEHGGFDFLRDALMAGNVSIAAFEHRGYVGRITSTMAYYRISLEMLNPAVWEDLFMGERLIYTRQMDSAPVDYKSTADVTDSLVANGCLIRGKVEHSILFRNVVIDSGAFVKNCIIMGRSRICSGVRLENAILDKNVVITADKRLSGAYSYPMIIGKGITI